MSQPSWLHLGWLVEEAVKEIAKDKLELQNGLKYEATMRRIRGENIYDLPSGVAVKPLIEVTK